MEPTPRIAEAVERLKGVFLEVSGTQLSLAQATLISGLDRGVCESVLSALEDAHFLKRGRDGRYQQDGFVSLNDPKATIDMLRRYHMASRSFGISIHT
jgi:hypothetical protein